MVLNERGTERYRPRLKWPRSEKSASFRQCRFRLILQLGAEGHRDSHQRPWCAHQVLLALEAASVFAPQQLCGVESYSLQSRNRRRCDPPLRKVWYPIGTVFCMMYDFSLPKFNSSSLKKMGTGRLLTFLWGPGSFSKASCWISGGMYLSWKHSQKHVIHPIVHVERAMLVLWVTEKVVLHLLSLETPRKNHPSPI